MGVGYTPYSPYWGLVGGAVAAGAVKGAQSLAKYAGRTKYGVGVGGSATWQGRFKGRPYRHYVDLASGHKEEVKVAGQLQQADALYIGCTSYPVFDKVQNDGTPLLPANLLNNSGTYAVSRALKVMCVSILRHYFRHFHAGRFEFESSNASYSSMLNMTGGGSYVGSNENINLYYFDAQGTGKVFTQLNILNGTTGGAGTYDNLWSMAEAMANDITGRWYTGAMLACIDVSRTSTTSPYPVLESHGVMRMEKVKLAFDCVTVLNVQNQSVADTTGGTNALDIESNPLHGKIFYFRGPSPAFASGYDTTGGTGFSDEWGVDNLGIPLLASTTAGNWNVSPYMCNMYTAKGAGAYQFTLNAPGGGWATIPKEGYFKNCVGSKSVSMEPGVQKKFALKFKFKGTLTDWLKKDLLSFAVNNPTSTVAQNQVLDFTRGHGSCAILVLEKRIRDFAGTNAQFPVSVAFQTDVFMKSKCWCLRTNMMQRVETNVS